LVAVNEKGQDGEALRVAHDRQLYREFLARLPAHSAIAALPEVLIPPSELLSANCFGCASSWCGYGHA
jgi:hypothetical protein